MSRNVYLFFIFFNYTLRDVYCLNVKLPMSTEWECIEEALPLPIPPLKLILIAVPDSCHGGIFVIILIPQIFTVSVKIHIHRINIDKFFIFFGQNYDSNMMLFFFSFIKKQILYIFLFKK
jgi:hypothetical protein